MQQIDTLKEKLNLVSAQLAKQSEIDEQTNRRIRILQDEKSALENRLTKVEEDLHNCNVARESLRDEKATVSTNSFFNLFHESFLSFHCSFFLSLKKKKILSKIRNERKIKDYNRF